MLKLEAVTASAGRFRLHPLDLEVSGGACHALLGPSGAGKSTVLELIVGFRRPNSGAIRLNGKDLAHAPVEKRNIGYLPQQLALFPHLNVSENVLYGIRCRRKPDAEDLSRVNSLLDAMDLKHRQHERTVHLSGGERQRVALARALAPLPELLILDEPFAALNETLRRELWRLLKELQQAYGITTLMVTHDLEEAFFLGEHVHVLIEGRLHQSGPRKHVFHRPATLDVARFLGIQNLFHARVVRDDGQEMLLECPSFGGQLMLRKGVHGMAKLAQGETITVGIRPEFVAIGGTSAISESENIGFQGKTVAVTESMHATLLSIMSLASGELVHATVFSCAETGIGPEKIVKVNLPLKHLFWIPEVSGFMQVSPPQA